MCPNQEGNEIMININKVKASAGDLAMLSKYRRAEAFEHETSTESMVLIQIYIHTGLKAVTVFGM